MKILAPLAGLLTAVPAMAHEVGTVAHVHPHGMEAALAFVALTAAVTYAAWKSRN